MKSTKITTIVLCAACCVANIASAELTEWTSWRGPNSNGSTPNGSYPTKFGPDHCLWKSELPGKGCSTPIIVDQQIVLTAASGGKDAVLAYSADGAKQWETTFGTEVEGKHRNGSGSNASAAADGSGIFVYFKSGTLASVELDGRIRWQTNLVERYGKDTLFWDHGTSPVLVNELVVMARMHQGESWLAAFDKKTGELAWKVARNYKTPVECDHGYSTPVIVPFMGKPSLLVWGAEHITIHDPSDGSVVWSCGNFNPDENRLWPAIAMPVIVGDMAVIAYGRNDRGIPRLHGVKLSGRGDQTENGHVWQRDDISTFVPSPIAYQGLVYLVRDKGEVECVDPKSGESLWSDRFPKGRAAYYASPIIAGGVLYAPREDGVVFVAKVGRDGFSLLEENDLGEPIIGSPVPTGNNRILLRGEKYLYCVSTEANESS